MYSTPLIGDRLKVTRLLKEAESYLLDEPRDGESFSAPFFFDLTSDTEISGVKSSPACEIF